MSGGILISLVSTIAAVGGLLFGYDTGIISAALLFVGYSLGPQDGNLGILVTQLITLAIVAGALAGCMGAGPLSDRIGRKLVVIVAAVIVIACSVAASWAPSITILIIARLILGLAIGAMSQLVPVYIAELAPADWRGTLVALFQLAIVTGILISSIIGWLLSASGAWRLMFLLGVVPAVILLVGMLLLPESPRFHLLNGKHDDARKTLLRVRNNSDTVDRELDAIQQTVRAECGWGSLFAPRVQPALLAGLGVAMFCQTTGTNAIIYYAPTILSAAYFGKNAALLTSLASGVTIVLTTIFGIWAVDHWGQHKLMLRFLPLALSLALLGFMLLNGKPHGTARWLAIAGLLGYEVFNVGSISVAIWLVGAEIFPLAVRGKGMSLVALSHWAFHVIISMTTLILRTPLGTTGTFWLFGSVNLLAWAFVWRFVPQTSRRTREQVEATFEEAISRRAETPP